MAMKRKKLPPLHPGEVLREEYMKPLGLSAYRIAKLCRVPRTRIGRIANEKIGITSDTALRLAKLFETTPEFWVSLQNQYELESAFLEIESELEQIEPEQLVA